MLLRRVACLPSVALALLLASPLVRADLWAFIDAAGVAHFASEQRDERYQLFFRGPGPEVATPASQPLGASIVDEAEADARPRRAWFERLPHYQPAQVHLQEASQRLNLDPHLLTALVATESGFNPVAVSPKGALGLMQIMPETALRYGVAPDGTQSQQRKLFDLATNIRAGTRYLRDLLNLFNGRLELALAAYNAGEGAVQRAGQQIPPYRETQNYVKTVLQLYAALRPMPPDVAQKVVAAPPAAPLAPAVLGGAIGRGNMISPRSILLPDARGKTETLNNESTK